MEPKRALRFLNILKDLMNVVSHEGPLIKRRIVWSLMLMCITIFLNVLSPFLLQKLVSHLSFLPNGEGSILIIIGVAYGFSWGMAQITMQLREITSFRVMERIVRRLTLKLFNKINSFPLKYFVQHQLGETLDTINKAQEGFPYLFSGLFFYLIPTLIEISFACIVLTILLPLKFTLIFLLMLFMYVGFSLWGIEKSTAYQNKSIEASHKTYSYLVDRLLNYETIKIFCTQDFESIQLDLHLKETEEAQTKASVFIESLRLGQGGILGFSLLFLTLTGIWSFLDRQVSLEGFILVNAYFMQLSPPLNYFSLIIKDIKSGLINMERAYEILNKKPESFQHLLKKEEMSNFKSIKFKKVSFGYNQRKKILHEIDFSLEEGKVVSLVGKTGSGKSTIAKLLLRFYDPSFGKILIDGKNCLDFPHDFIRQNIGYVSQDPVLFCDTILYNLTYGNLNASKKEIETAIEKANLEDLITNLPKGLHTLVGERGVSLSGGEKQRLALARIFLTKKKFYIFDESTSGLDPKTQLSLQNHILSLKEAASILIISHRLSTVVESDEILVLSEGKIIERGDHSTLISLNKAYAELWSHSFLSQMNKTEAQVA